MIAELFKTKKVFIAYMTVGDNDLDYQLEAALAMGRGGVDLLEIGIPFSDPVADGPVIQEAMTKALQRGTKSRDVLKLVEKIKEHSSMSLMLFSYANPLLQLGPRFLEKAKALGVEALLAVDLPIEEQARLQTEMPMIQILTPSTSDERRHLINQNGEGFLYFACQKGTTGLRKELPSQFAEDMSRIKTDATLPVVAGFGISNQEAARQALSYADGFVVGSALVKTMRSKPSMADLEAFVRSLDPR